MVVARLRSKDLMSCPEESFCVSVSHCSVSSGMLWWTWITPFFSSKHVLHKTHPGGNFSWMQQPFWYCTGFVWMCEQRLRCYVLFPRKDCEWVFGCLRLNSCDAVLEAVCSVVGMECMRGCSGVIVRIVPYLVFNGAIRLHLSHNVVMLSQNALKIIPLHASVQWGSYHSSFHCPTHFSKYCATLYSRIRQFRDWMFVLLASFFLVPVERGEVRWMSQLSSLELERLWWFIFHH